MREAVCKQCSEAVQLFVVLYDYWPDPTYRFELRAFLPRWQDPGRAPDGSERSRARGRAWFPLTEEGFAAGTARALEWGKQYDVYHGVLPRVGENGKAVDVPSVGILWCEIDGDETGPQSALRLLESRVDAGVIPKPHIVVISGGGIHCYWLLKDPETLSTDADRNKVKGIVQRIVQVINGGETAPVGPHAGRERVDVASILRTPGTFNRKNEGSPRPVEIHSLDRKLPGYPLDWWDANLPPLPAADAPKPVEPIVRAGDRVAASEIVAKAVSRCETEGRNNSGHWLACQLRDNGYEQAETADLLREYAGYVGTMGDHPYTEREALASVKQAYSRSPRDPWAEPGVELTPGKKKLVRVKADDPAVHEDDEPLPAEDTPPFPVDVLPEPLRSLVVEGAAAMPCPPDFIAVPLLTLLGSAIGTTRRIQVKPGWTESAVVWTAVVAEPGSKKSPALSLAADALRKLQEAFGNKLKADQESYKAELIEYQVALEAWKTGIRAGTHNASDKPEEPTEPKLRQILTTDTTLEALNDVLVHNPRGVVFLRDELAGWATSMNQYKGGKGNDRQGWLSFWNGDSPLVNRKNQEPSVLKTPFVAVTGAMPPDELSKLTAENGREDGFIHRILFSFPERMPVKWTQASIDPEKVAAVRRVFDTLRTLHWTVGEDGEDAPIVVRFTQGGQEALIELLTAHYAEMADDKFIERHRGPWSKMEGYAARLALIIHFTREACGEVVMDGVDANSVGAAGGLLAYFKGHCRNVYSRLHSTPEDLQIEHALKWIRKHGDEVSARDINRYRVANTNSPIEAKALLRRLEKGGFGTVTEGDRGKVSFKLLSPYLTVDRT